MKENKQHLPKNSAVPPFLLGKMIFVSFVLGAQNLNLVIALFFSPSHSQNGTPISPPSNHQEAGLVQWQCVVSDRLTTDHHQHPRKCCTSLASYPQSSIEHPRRPGFWLVGARRAICGWCLDVSFPLRNQPKKTPLGKCIMMPKPAEIHPAWVKSSLLASGKPCMML